MKNPFLMFSIGAIILFTLFFCFVAYCIRQNKQLVEECEALGRTHYDCVIDVQNSISGNLRRR